MKEGQRYWATFALRHIQSFLCAQKMQDLLTMDTEENAVHVERGALLLVKTTQFHLFKDLAGSCGLLSLDVLCFSMRLCRLHECQ